MISYLSGPVIDSSDKYVVISAGGVGYKVFMTENEARRASKIGAAEVWTHLAVRETAFDLYGFSDKNELSFFELLLTVSGIGPKTALGILNIAPVETILSAVQKNDAGYLTKNSGVGTKNAQKIVLELKGKTDGFAISGANEPTEDDDAQDALLALGYSQREAREALREIGDKEKTLSEKIRMALKILGK